jgi:hypothetical protein
MMPIPHKPFNRPMNPFDASPTHAPPQALLTLPHFAAALLDRLDVLIKVLSGQYKATRIVLALPVLIRKDGTVMAEKLELKNNMVEWIAIHVVDAAGDVVPAPSGDVFSATSSDDKMVKAEIGTMPFGPLQGAVALGLTPMVKLADATAALVVTVADTSNLTKAELDITIVGDLTPAAINLDTTDAVFVPQAVPAA